MPNSLLHRLNPTMNPVFRLFQLASLVMTALVFWACPTSNTPQSLDYARTPYALHIDTVGNFHPFCLTPEPNFSSQADCEAAQKFRISWEPPDDTVGLIGYRFYLDTNVYGNIPEKTTWAQIQKRRDYADVIVGNILGLEDSIIFAVGKSKSLPDSVDVQNPHVVLLDTTGRFPKSGNANMSIIAIYSAGHSEGQPSYGPAQIGDRYPPVPVQVETDIFATHFISRWVRPIDAVSFFNPGDDTGTIREYRMRLYVSGFRPYLRGEKFHPQIQYIVESDTVKIQDSLPITDDKGRFIGVQYTLPDLGHFHRDRKSPQEDQLTLSVTDLNPLDTLILQVVAIDMAGNSMDILNSTKNKILLTDTTEPEKPDLKLDSSGTTRNRLVLRWEPSRDSIVVDGQLQRAAKPDDGIFQYRLIRELIQDSAVLSRKDTLIAAGQTIPDGFYTDTLTRLPPNKSYRFILIAADSSGHLSQRDTLLAVTLPVAFMGSDSILKCPVGFIPIPGKSIILGDTAAVAGRDERPAYIQGSGKILTSYVASFCMEPTEHQNSNGTFASSISWPQADSICRNLSVSDSTRLCSEAQWERACEGGDSLSHLYGYLGDRIDPSFLLGDCNQGTGDSLPAIKANLRGNKCLTNEGVFDMPGQLSEWVLDAYDSLAYSKLNQDTLPYSFVFQGTDSLSHSFRGGNYLKPNIPSSQLQTLARCSNRDVPRQVRPKFKSECVDTVPKILVFFGSDFDQHHCLDYPAKAKDHPISVIIPALDSVHIVVSYADSGANPDSLKIPSDIITKGKLATSVTATTLSLAVIRFDSPAGIQEDTLDAREFRDTSSVTRRKIIQREAGTGNSPVEVNGRPYVKMLFAYAQASSRPARLNYTSKAIAFRCCAKPSPAQVPVDSIGN